MSFWNGSKPDVAAPPPPRFPGERQAVDGSAAVVAMETAASEAAGAYPITPSTQMGEGWAAAVAEGKTNVNGRRLLFFEPEGEHAAAAVTAGMSMMGMRSANFSSGQGIAYMHESLYAAVGKRLTYVLNVAARAMTKQGLNVHAGHDDYHAVDDTGFFQLFAKNVQESADFTLIAHRVAELALNPGISAQDGFLTSHAIESVRIPERALVKAYLGDSADQIDSPTPAQRLVFGDRRRRVPEMFDLDYPAMLGVVQNQDSYAQGVAAQRPFYFDHIAGLTDLAMREFETLTGRKYARASGYKIGNAEYVIAGQGSVVSDAEAVADHLQETRGLRIGVLNLSMFRPFPADLVSRMLRGKIGVLVLERLDQPLAVDPPLLRELRSAMSKSMENGRVDFDDMPYPGLSPSVAHEIPDFFSGCFGMGSRDLKPGDIIAAVENMLPDGKRRRQFYLGLDFLRENTRIPKLQLWQQELADRYPDLRGLALPTAGDVNLLPPSAVAVRIHSVGGWGAITMGKNLTSTVFDLLGLEVKANPKYGSEKKGQPTTFYATFAKEPIRLNCELTHVNVVLSPDPKVFQHSDPLAGLADGGAFVIQCDTDPATWWQSLPMPARRALRQRNVRVYLLDGFGIAGAEASDADLRYRMQGAAFMGAFFAVSGLTAREGLDDTKLFAGIREQLTKKFARLGQRVVDDNFRVIERGFREIRAFDCATQPLDGTDGAAVPEIPELLNEPDALQGIGNPGRFWEQVCFINKAGQDGIADPYAAISAIPAATGAVRDMTGVRLEVPQFIAANCTGCAQCWTQCPDAAIPGLVTETDQLIEVGIAAATNGRPLATLKQVSKPLAKETKRLLGTTPFVSFAATLDDAFKSVTAKLTWDEQKRASLDEDYARLRAKLAHFPLAKTRPFYDGPEAKQAGSGALLSVTINPEACKGCNLCVAVCPDGALVTAKQTPEIVSELRENWKLWQRLPDTPERFINVRDIDQGIGVLPTLLLRKDSYRSMVGGDGACMGCGEKTSVHLIVSTIHSLMLPRVAHFVQRLDKLLAALDAKARGILSSAADLDAVLAASRAGTAMPLPIADQDRARLDLIVKTLHAIEDLRWRYVEGPSGKGRAMMGMANSTGCSSVWGSTYPYNPYPFPWVNHLFQDSPSVAIGLFEGHMRKMADAFVTVRRASLLAEDQYDAERDEADLRLLDWQHFTDEEFALCPPIVAMGGDGAMLDIGFQNLSRLLASGKPIRVIVLDTQVYSNTGGQACTSGFTGQVSDMAAWGKAQHGKTEVRKELAMIAMAHRGAYVLQSSQASPSHLIAGVLRGLNKRRPAVFNIYTPCPVEHGLADDVGMHAARLALESRAFPYLTFDPDAGPAFSDALSLDGNPSVNDDWPTYSLKYVDDAGAEATMDLPLTIADWAATEGRFRKNFSAIAKDESRELVPFHEFVALAPDDRTDKLPFIYEVGADRRLGRRAVSPEMVALAEERLRFWHQLKEMAGLAPSETVRANLTATLEGEFQAKLTALTAEYEAKMTDLRATYPREVARKLADALLRVGTGNVADMLTRVGVGVGVGVSVGNGSGAGSNRVKASSAAPPTAITTATATPAPTATAPAAATSAAAAAPTPTPTLTPTAVLDLDPWIDSDRCTTCNECTNLNAKMFGYNADKQATIKDPDAGTFAQLVTAAERCPVGIIHPGTPRNPREKDLAKWVKRAEPFN